MFVTPWIRALRNDIITSLNTLNSNREYIGIPVSASYENGAGVRVLDYACGNGILSPVSTHSSLSPTKSRLLTNKTSRPRTKRQRILGYKHLTSILTFSNE